MKKEIKEFLHSIDVNILKSELKKDIPDIANLADITENGVFKWAWEKSKNGSRPSYNVLIKLLKAGATVETLFGVDYKGPVKPPVLGGPLPPEIANDPDFLAGQNQALKDIEAKIEARITAKLKAKGIDL